MLRDCKLNDNVREEVERILSTWGSMQGRRTSVLAQAFALSPTVLGTVIAAAKKLIRQSQTLSQSGVGPSCWQLPRPLLDRVTESLPPTQYTILPAMAYSDLMGPRPVPDGNVLTMADAVKRCYDITSLGAGKDPALSLWHACYTGVNEIRKLNTIGPVRAMTAIKTTAGGIPDTHKRHKRSSASPSCEDPYSKHRAFPRGPGPRASIHQAS